MKNKLFRIIFKKELEEYFNYLNREYKRQVHNLNSEKEKITKKNDLTKRIFDSFPSAQIIGIDKNKNDAELFIVISNEELYLLGERYQWPRGVPRIFFKISSVEREGIKTKHLNIIDFLMEDNNIGNGTVAMNGLIKYAKINNCQYISGSLSFVDNGHADRRDYFYRKFGFTIQNKKIRLDL